MIIGDKKYYRIEIMDVNGELLGLISDVEILSEDNIVIVFKEHSTRVDESPIE